MTQPQAPSPTPAVPSAQPQALGAMIDLALEYRDQIKVLEGEASRIKALRDQLELDIMAKLDAQETTMSRGHAASATITEALVPVVEDWDSFYAHIIATGAPYLLERRPAIGAYRELIQSGQVVPGVSSFNRRTISLRKLSKDPA